MADTGSVLDVPRKRWLRCFILHAVFSSILWLCWGSHMSNICLWSLGRKITIPFPQKVLRYLAFLASQLVFMLGELLVILPEDQDAASAGDILYGGLKLAWRAFVGVSLGGTSRQETAVLLRKIQMSRDRVLFLFICAISGAVSMISLTWNMPSRLNALEEACRGVAAGLAYGIMLLYTKRTILYFPIIQREVFFSFKVGLSDVGLTGLKIAVASLPFSEAALFILSSSTLAARGARRQQQFFLIRELDFLVASFSAAICWELGHHLVQVLHTKRYRFAPPFGSAAAETSPSDMLLMALEETEKSSLTHYLAALDLCMLCETNTDRWRMCALFEETGETYQRIVLECLKPLDLLTLKLANRLDEFSTNQDLMQQQMQSPGQYAVVSGRESSRQLFADLQICTWSARSMASLTAFSKDNDQYGVAQLRGCNGAVVSALLSCLLIVEVYLGRRSSMQSGQFVGANSIKWTVLARGGPVSDTGKGQSFPFRKKSELHKKAYAMADVLRTSLYQIVSTFRSEMIVSGSGRGIAERDWLGKGKPLFGTREMHLQKLASLLEFHV